MRDIPDISERSATHLSARRVLPPVSRGLQPSAMATTVRLFFLTSHFSVPFPRVRTQIAISPGLTGVFGASRLEERDTRRSEACLRPRSIERLPRCNGRPREVVPSLVAVALFGFPADRGRAAAPSRSRASALPAERISARSIHLLRADSFVVKLSEEAYEAARSCRPGR